MTCKFYNPLTARGQEECAQHHDCYVQKVSDELLIEAQINDRSVGAQERIEELVRTNRRLENTIARLTTQVRGGVSNDDVQAAILQDLMAELSEVRQAFHNLQERERLRAKHYLKARTALDGFMFKVQSLVFEAGQTEALEELRKALE